MRMSAPEPPPRSDHGGIRPVPQGDRGCKSGPPWNWI